jgi:hypothetical protein
MLRQILAEFQQAAGPLCVDELSRKLEVEVSALDGMLQTLVRNRRLLEISPTTSGCVTCPAKGGCIILTNGVQKSYFLPPQHRTKNC